jgi:hypothetical protein
MKSEQTLQFDGQEIKICVTVSKSDNKQSSVTNRGFEITVVNEKWLNDYVKDCLLYFKDAGLSCNTDVTAFLRSQPIGEDVKTETVKVDSLDEAILYARWGTYGVLGDRRVRWVLLKDCATDHLFAILRTQNQISNDYRTIIQSIISLRK